MLAALLAAVASSPVGAPRCFIDPLWANSSIRVVEDIAYGAAFNNATHRDQVLLLDAYLPPSPDNRTSVPVAVVVHGGSFDAGNKSLAGDVRMAMELATRGFAAVSIDYRLTGDFWSWESEQMILDAVQDIRSAVRYLRSVAASQRLDVRRIFLVGESAGAIASLFLGYVSRAQPEGHSGNPGWSSAVAGVVAISGELKCQGFCSAVVAGRPVGCKVQTDRDDTDAIEGANAAFEQPPLLQLHGTDDLVVPYVNGKAVSTRAASVGLPSTLITMQAGHVPWDVIFTPGVFGQAMEAIASGLDLASAQQPAGCIPL